MIRRRGKRESVCDPHPNPRRRTTEREKTKGTKRGKREEREGGRDRGMPRKRHHDQGPKNCRGRGHQHRHWHWMRERPFESSIKGEGISVNIHRHRSPTERLERARERERERGCLPAYPLLYWKKKRLKQKAKPCWLLTNMNPYTSNHLVWHGPANLSSTC